MEPKQLTAWQSLTDDTARDLLAAVTEVTGRDHPDVMARAYDTAAALLTHDDNGVPQVAYAARVAAKRARAYVARQAQQHRADAVDWTEPAMADALADALHAQRGSLTRGETDPAARFGWNMADLLALAGDSLTEGTITPIGAVLTARAASWADADAANKRGKRVTLTADADAWAVAMRQALAATGDPDPMGAAHPAHTSATALADRRRYDRTIDGTRHGQAGTYDLSPIEAWQAARPNCREARAHLEADNAHRAECSGCDTCHTCTCGRAFDWTEDTEDDVMADRMTGLAAKHSQTDPTRVAMGAHKAVVSPRKKVGGIGPLLTLGHRPQH